MFVHHNQPSNMHATLVQILSNLAQLTRQFLAQFFRKFCAIFPFFATQFSAGTNYSNCQ